MKKLALIMLVLSAAAAACSGTSNPLPEPVDGGSDTTSDAAGDTFSDTLGDSGDTSGDTPADAGDTGGPRKDCTKDDDCASISPEAICCPINGDAGAPLKCIVTSDGNCPAF